MNVLPYGIHRRNMTPYLFQFKSYCQGLSFQVLARSFQVLAKLQILLNLQTDNLNAYSFSFHAVVLDKIFKEGTCLEPIWPHSGFIPGRIRQK